MPAATPHYHVKRILTLLLAATMLTACSDEPRLSVSSNGGGGGEVSGPTALLMDDRVAVVDLCQDPMTRKISEGLVKRLTKLPGSRDATLHHELPIPADRNAIIALRCEYQQQPADPRFARQLLLFIEYRVGYPGRRAALPGGVVATTLAKRRYTLSFAGRGDESAFQELAIQSALDSALQFVTETRANHSSHRPTAPLPAEFWGQLAATPRMPFADVRNLELVHARAGMFTHDIHWWRWPAPAQTSDPMDVLNRYVELLEADGWDIKGRWAHGPRNLVRGNEALSLYFSERDEHRTPSVWCFNKPGYWTIHAEYHRWFSETEQQAAVAALLADAATPAHHLAALQYLHWSSKLHRTPAGYFRREFVPVSMTPEQRETVIARLLASDGGGMQHHLALARLMIQAGRPDDQVFGHFHSAMEAVMKDPDSMQGRTPRHVFVSANEMGFSSLVAIPEAGQFQRLGGTVLDLTKDSAELRVKDRRPDAILVLLPGNRRLMLDFWLDTATNSTVQVHMLERREFFCKLQSSARDAQPDVPITSPATFADSSLSAFVDIDGELRLVIEMEAPDADLGRRTRLRLETGDKP